MCLSVYLFPACPKTVISKYYLEESVRGRLAESKREFGVIKT